jgi:hypothetical protein
MVIINMDIISIEESIPKCPLYSLCPRKALYEYFLRFNFSLIFIQYYCINLMMSLLKIDSSCNDERPVP